MARWKLKGQESANYVKKQLKDLSLKVQTTVQPVFASRKINQDLSWREKATDRKPTTRCLSFSM